MIEILVYLQKRSTICLYSSMIFLSLVIILNLVIPFPEEASESGFVQKKIESVVDSVKDSISSFANNVLPMATDFRAEESIDDIGIQPDDDAQIDQQAETSPLEILSDTSLQDTLLKGLLAVLMAHLLIAIAAPRD